MKKIFYILFLFLENASCQPNMNEVFIFNKPQRYQFINQEAKTIDSVNTFILFQNYTYKEKVAIDKLISSLKTNGTWNKYKLINTMAGGNYSSCSINYKNPTSTRWHVGTEQFAYTQLFDGQANFSRKWGIKGDGFNFFINSQFAASNSTQTNQSYGAYILRAYSSTTTGSTVMSSVSGNNYNNFTELQLYKNTSTISINGFSNNGSTVATVSSTTGGFNIKGYTVVSRTSASSLKLYTPSLTSSTITTNAGNNSEGTYYFLGRNGNLNYTTCASANIGAFIVADGLSDTEYANDKSVFDAFFSNLGVLSFDYNKSADINLIMEGDSQTENASCCYAWWIPDKNVRTGINAGFRNALVSYYNVAIGGTTIGPYSTSNSMLRRYADSVKPKKNNGLINNIITLWGGTNDLCIGRTPEDIYADIVTYVQTAKADGFKIVVGTTLPRSQTACATVVDGTYETKRQTLNKYILNGRQLYGYEVAHVGGDFRVGKNGDSDNTIYYNADKVHLVSAGAIQIYKYFEGAILNLVWGN